jgi:enterochelin esterase family protein
MKCLAAIAALAVHVFSLNAGAQAPAPPPLQTHEVHPNGSITFRTIAPGARSVGVALDIYAKPLAMTQGENGVWSITTVPLKPEFYGYNLSVDGKTMLDPLNPDVRFNYQYLANQVLVPGQPSAPWELTAIPHGRLDHVRFTTHVAKHLPNDQSAYMVYTPPGYDEHRKGGYPVLYLLHGWSDNETGWTEIGRAEYILDTLIAEHKAVPMIVVMPLGYGDLDFVTHDFAVWGDHAKVMENVRLFEQSLLTEVMPAVEQVYDVAKGRESRAIVGLSMGGLESLTIGLNHTDKFAYVGGMSSAIHDQSFDTMLPALAAPDAAKKADLKLLWVACGTEDGLITPNRAFVAWAKAKGLKPVAVETPGLHIWTVWRDNLVAFAPLLFKGRE